MLTGTVLQATLAAAATFPTNYFLENLVVRSDNSILITVLNHKELWYVPPSSQSSAEPRLLFTFPQFAMGIVEDEPDVFYIASSDIYTSHESHLNRLDLRGWVPGTKVSAQDVLRFPEPVRGLNGSVVVAPGIILIADCFAGLIWRVDLNTNAGKPTARVWLTHDDSMGYYPGQMKPEQPGINGVKYVPKSNYLYYTNTAKQLFMRVKTDPDTFNPIGEPEFVGGGRMFDDFCIDESVGFAYLTTHRQNTIDRLSLEPGRNTGERHSVAGDPFTEELIGPSAGAWGRAPGEYGRVAYFTTDGGSTAPPEGGPRPAKLVRVELPR